MVLKIATKIFQNVNVCNSRIFSWQNQIEIWKDFQSVLATQSDSENFTNITRKFSFRKILSSQYCFRDIQVLNSITGIRSNFKYHTTIKEVHCR